MSTAAIAFITFERVAHAPSRTLASGGPDLAWMATAIVVSLAVLLAVGVIARRVLGAAWRQRATRRSLSVLDVLPLGGKRQLIIVRCYDRTLALGVGDRQVSLITELDSDVVAVERKREGSDRVPRVPDFRELLEKARSVLRGPATGSTLDVRVGDVKDFVLPTPGAATGAGAPRARLRPRPRSDSPEARDEVVA